MELSPTNFIKKIEHNKANYDAGFFNTIPFVNSPQLNDTIPGIIPGKLYLISALTGVGKSKFLRGSVIASINAFKKLFPRFKVNLTFFSLEEDEDTLLINFIAQELARKFPYKKYNIKTILSIGEGNTLSDAEIQYIKMRVDYFNDIVNGIDFQVMTNIDEIYDYLLSKRMEQGQMDGERFIPNDPYEINIYLIDHIKLLTGRGEHKPTMDTWSSEFAIDLTKNWGYAGIHVQQQSMSAMKTKNPFDLEPKYEKLGEHKNSIQDAHFFIGLFQPSIYDITKYLGYDLSIENFKDNFRAAVISKNRMDRVIKRVAYLLDAEREIWHEIPKSTHKVELASFMMKHNFKTYFENNLDNYYEKKEQEDAPF